MTSTHVHLTINTAKDIRTTLWIIIDSHSDLAKLQAKQQ